MSTARIAAQRLFVRNLPWSVSNAQLKEYFSKFGHVSSASVAFDKETGMSRGYGFVSFSLGDVTAAVLQKGHTLHGRVIILEPSTQGLEH